MNKIRNFFVVLMLVAQGSALFSMDSKQAVQKGTSLGKRKRQDHTDNTEAPREKKRKNEISSTRSFCFDSLKQDKQSGHALHCGYYALWNALCSVSTGPLNGKHLNQESFKDHLGLWEAKVRHKRTGQVGSVASFISHMRALVSRDTNVNNLETDELDCLVDSLVENRLLAESPAERAAENLAAADNVTVFASKNQISQLIEGHGLSSALLERIRKFRHDGLPQAFLINTGADDGQKNSGCFHWIAAVLTRLPVKVDNYDYSLNFYDSGFVPVGGQAYNEYGKSFNPIINSLRQLFIEQDLNQLRARSLLSSKLHAVKIYSDQAKNIKNSDGNPLFWELDVYSQEYINFLESYLQSCIKILVPDEADTLNKKPALQRSKPKYKEDNACYAAYLRRKNTKMQQVLRKVKISTDWSKIKSLHKYIPMLQGVAGELAVNKLAQMYHEFVLTAQVEKAAFIQAALDFGIPQNIIDVGINQAENVFGAPAVPIDSK